MKNILINKKCFITGVTGVLGFELARLFAKNKCKIFKAYIRAYIRATCHKKLGTVVPIV